MPKIGLTNVQPQNSSPQENIQQLTQDTQEIKQFLQSVNPFQFNFKDSLNDISKKLDNIIDLLSQQNKISLKQKNQQQNKSTTLGETIQEKVQPQTTNISEQIKNKRNELNFRNKLISFLSTINSQLLNIPKLIVSPLLSLFKPFIGLFSKLFGFLNKFIFSAPWFKWILKSGQVLFKWLYQYLILSIFKFLLAPLKFLGGGLLKFLTPILGILFKPLLWLLKPLFKPLLTLGKILWVPIKWLGGLLLKPLKWLGSLLLKPLKQLGGLIQKPFQSLFSKIGKKTLQKSVQEKQVSKDTTQQKGGQLQSISQFIVSLGTPQQILGQVTLILIQVQLRILRPIIEKFIEVQGNVFIKQIQGIVEVLKDVGVTVRESIGQFVDIIKIVQDLQKQGDNVQKNFKLISSGIVQIGFAFVEFSQQLIGINMQQLLNVVTNFIGSLTGRQPTSLVDFINMFVNDFIMKLVNIQSGLNEQELQKFNILSSSTQIFASQLNEFTNVLLKYQIGTMFLNLLNLLSPLTWFSKGDNSISRLINSFLYDFVEPTWNIVNQLPSIDTEKFQLLSSIVSPILSGLNQFNSLLSKYSLSNIFRNIIDLLNPNKDSMSSLDELINSFFNFINTIVLEFKRLTNLDDKSINQISQQLKQLQTILSLINDFKSINVSEKITNQVQGLNTITVFLNKLVDFIKKGVSTTNNIPIKDFTTFYKILSISLKLVSSLTNIFNKTTQTITKLVSITFNRSSKLFTSKSSPNNMVKFINNITGSIMDNLFKLWNKFIQYTISNIRLSSKLDSQSINNFSNISLTSIKILKPLSDIFINIYNSVSKLVIDSANTILPLFNTRDKVQKLEDISNVVSKQTTTILDNLIQIYNKFISSVINTLTSPTISKIEKSNVDTFNNITNSSVENLKLISSIYLNIYNTVTNSIISQANNIRGLFTSIGTIKTINDINTQISNVSGTIMDNLLQFFNKFTTSSINSLKSSSTTISKIDESTIKSFSNVLSTSVSGFSSLSNIYLNIYNTITKSILDSANSIIGLFKFKSNITNFNSVQDISKNINNITGVIMDDLLQFYNKFIETTSNSLKSYQSKSIDTKTVESFSIQLKQSINAIGSILSMNDLLLELKSKHVDYSFKGMWDGIKFMFGQQDNEIQKIITKQSENIKTLIEFGVSVINATSSTLINQKFSINDQSKQIINLFDATSKTIKSIFSSVISITDSITKYDSKEVNKAKSQASTVVSEYISLLSNTIGQLASQDYKTIVSNFMKFRENIQNTIKQIDSKSTVSADSIISIIMGGFKGFSTGGFTGEGQIDEVQGIVHKNEYVIPSFLIDKYQDVISQIEKDRIQFLQKSKSTQIQVSKGVKNIQSTVNQVQNMGYRPLQVGGTQQTSLVLENVQSNETTLQTIGKTFKNIFGTILPELSKTINKQSFDIKPETLNFFDKIILLTIKLQQLQKSSKDLSNISEINKNIIKQGKSVSQYVNTLSQTVEDSPDIIKENLKLTGTDLTKQVKQQKTGTGTDIIQQLKSDLSGSIGTLYNTNIEMTTSSGDFISYLTKLIPTLQFESSQQKQGLSKLNPLFLEKLKIFMNTLFNESKKQLKGQIPIIQINSSYRTIEEQINLYKKNPKTQQQPGNSPHQYGFQLDYSVIDPKTKKVITDQQQIKQQSLKQQSVQGLLHGLQFKNFPPEPWHVQMLNWEQYVPDQVWQYVDELLKKYKLPPRTVGKKVSSKGKGFSIGGFTGIGDMEEVQGVVHKNEYVIPSFLVEKYKDIILQIEQDRINYLNKMNTSLKQFAEGGQTSSVFTLSKQDNKTDVKTITVNFTNELKLEGVKVKDIGTQIVMLQLSYIDKYGKEDKELQEQFNKITKSIVGTVVEQYSKDSFLKSLNDTLVIIFEKLPLVNSKDIQNILKQSIQELLKKVLESVNTYISNLVKDIKIENIESNIKKQFEEKNKGVKYVTLNEVLINIITTIIEYTKDVLSNQFGFVNEWYIKIFYQLDVQQKLIEMLISYLSNQEIYDTVFKHIFNNMIPTLLTILINSQFIITDKMSYKEIVEKNSSFEKSLNSLSTLIVTLFNFVFENISSTLSTSISVIKDSLWGLINGVVKLYLSSIIVAELIKSLNSFLPKLLNEVILSNLYTKITKYLSSYIDTIWSLTMDKLFKKFETEEDIIKFNLKLKEYPAQETLQDGFKNFTDSVNRLVQQIMVSTFGVLTDIFNGISFLINNPITLGTLKFLGIGILTYLVYELGKSLINPDFWQKIGKSISGLVNSLSDLIAKSLLQIDTSKQISTQLLNDIIGNIVKFILDVFSKITDLLLTDKMVKMQTTLLESNNIVLNIVGGLIPILSLVVMGLMSYILYNTANEIVNIFKVLFTPENISKQQSQMSGSDLVKVIESVVSGVLSIFTSVISGQFNLITSNLGNDLSSIGNQALGPIGMILDFGMNLLLKGMQLYLIVQMSTILDQVISLLRNITPSIIRIFEILFSNDNLNKLQLSLLSDNIDKYQDLIINIINKIIDLMINLSIKIIDFVVGGNKKSENQLINIKLNTLGSLTDMIMKLFILPKMLDILTHVIKLLENIIIPIINIFNSLFSKDNLQRLVNSMLTDSLDKYQDLQTKTISTIVDFMIQTTLLIIQYGIQKKTTSTPSRGGGILGFFFGFVNNVIDSKFNYIFNNKAIEILDHSIKIFQNVSEILPILFGTLFSQENINKLVDYLLTSGQDKYFDLQSKVILSIVDMFIKMVFEITKYIMSLSQQNKIVIGFIKIGGNEFTDKMKTLVDTVITLMSNITTSITTLFNNIFSQKNIDNLINYMLNEDVKTYQTFTLNIINKFIDMYIQIAIFSVTESLKRILNTPNKIIITFIPFENEINTIMKVIQDNISSISSQVVKLINVLFTEENLTKLLNDEGLLKEIMIEIIKNIIHTILSPLYSILGEQQYKQLTKKQVKHIITYKQFLWFKIPSVQTIETASLQEQLQSKIDEVMRIVVSNIVKQLDSFKSYVENTDLSITLINSFIQSLDVITEKLEESLLQNIDFDTIQYEFDFQNKQIQFKIQNVNELKTKFEKTKLELMNEQNDILTNIHKELIEIKEIAKEIRDNNIVRQNSNNNYTFPYLEKLSIGS